MPLIVEDGTVKAGADAYVETTYADTYHADRNNVAWTAASAPVKEAAIRVATQYLDGRYYSRWKGTVINVLQARQWPRWGVKVDGARNISSANYDVGFSVGLLPNNLIPEQIKQATCELALRALKGSLAQDLPRGGRVSSVTVGPITKSFEAGAPGSTTYQVVDQLVAPFIASQNMTRISRG